MTCIFFVFRKKWICSRSSRSVSDLSDLLDLGSEMNKWMKIKRKPQSTEERIGKETQTREEFFPSMVVQFCYGTKSHRDLTE
jgi:hypothetical protein